MRRPIVTAFLVFSIFLAGCARDPSYYQAQSSMELCMQYLTLPSINIHQSDRARELARRGENCAAYVPAANARNRSNADFERSMMLLQQGTQMMTPPQPSYQNTVPRTYNMNGRTVTCTTTGTITNCF
jgi:hypothetical protein